MKPHSLYADEWVRTTLLSRSFKPVDARCELCRKLNCGPYWYSVKTMRVRCYGCFDATAAAMQRKATSHEH